MPAGTSPHGGVLVMAGDDHGAKSSTVPHQSEFALVDAMMPILNPAGLQEILDYGVHGFALSRYSGCWVGIKCVHDTVESTAVVEAGLDRVTPIIPTDFKMPPGGLNIRPVDDRLDQESAAPQLQALAAVAYAQANGLNEIVFAAVRTRKIGIVSTGKSYLDVRQALDELGIDEVEAAKIGLRLLKVGMVWPLDPVITHEFANGLDLIICVEEKRLLLETHVRELLFNERERAAGHRQAGRERQSAVPGLRHARAEPDRARHRRAHPGARPMAERRCRRRSNRERCGRAEQRTRSRDAHPLFLRRLSA